MGNAFRELQHCNTATSNRHHDIQEEVQVKYENGVWFTTIYCVKSFQKVSYRHFFFVPLHTEMGLKLMEAFWPTADRAFQPNNGFPLFKFKTTDSAF